MFDAIQAADSKLFLTVFSNHGHTSLTKTARLISRTADGWFYGLLLPVIFLFKPGLEIKFIILAVTGFGLERLIYYVLKTSLKRRRPPKFLDGVESLITAADEFSLPSGHTSAAFFFVTFLCAGISLIFLPLYLWSLFVGLFLLTLLNI